MYLALLLIIAALLALYAVHELAPSRWVAVMNLFNGRVAASAPPSPETPAR